MINNGYDVILHISKESNENECQEELINYLKNSSFLSNLFPYLIQHRMLHIFYNYLVLNQLTYLLDKASYNLINQIVTFSTLKAKAYENQFRILHREFEREGIPYVVIKGFHLNHTVYAVGSNFILRDYNDIDLLVNRSDLSKVNRTLKGEGFIQGNLNRKTLCIEACSREERIDMLINTHQQYQHVKPAEYYDISPYNTQFLDVNFTLWEGGNQPDYMETAFLLEQRVLRSTHSGSEYWSLKPPYDLIQLCYHLYKDTNYEVKIKSQESLRMIHLYDILVFIRSYESEIFNDSFYEIIVSAHIENQMYFVLSLINAVFSCRQVEALLLRLYSSVSHETMEKIKLCLDTVKYGK